MNRHSRRKFLRTIAATGVGAAISQQFTTETKAAVEPGRLSIVRYAKPSLEQDGISEEARRLTRQAIEALGGIGKFISKGDVVWVKPNIAWDRRPEQAATTNPDVVAAIVELCYEAGSGEVFVSDNTCNKAQRTFPRSGIEQAAEKAGARVSFYDTRKFRDMALNGKVLSHWKIYADIVEADKFINVPIAKHHGLCKATLGMKNLMGVAGGRRNRFHQDLSNTLADLAAFLKPDLIVMDAIRMLTANGPIGGNLADVKRGDTVVAGTDQVAVDAVGANLLGYQPEEIGYIQESASRGLGTMEFGSLLPIERTI